MTNPVSVEGESPEVTFERIIRLGFGGDRGKFDRFIDALQAVIPADVCVALRGSAVTGSRWADGSPFDADGPGTSDLDLTFVGASMLHHFNSFYIPALHTVPFGEDHPDASPTLAPLREQLCAIAGRPVNIQATADLVQHLRDVTMNQPYYVIIDRAEESPEAKAVNEALQG